jgi:hypothetical protein
MTKPIDPRDAAFDAALEAVRSASKLAAERISNE